MPNARLRPSTVRLVLLLFGVLMSEPMTRKTNLHPWVSVVTAVYDRSDAIGDAIDSTLPQAEVNIELVI